MDSLNTGNHIDDWIKRIEENGGKIVRPKDTIVDEGRGWFAFFHYTEGNRLGLYGETKISAAKCKHSIVWYIYSFFSTKQI